MTTTEDKTPGPLLEALKTSQDRLAELSIEQVDQVLAIAEVIAGIRQPNDILDIVRNQLIAREAIKNELAVVRTLTEELEQYGVMTA